MSTDKTERTWVTQRRQDETTVSTHGLLGIQIHSDPKFQGPTWWLSWHRIGVKSIPLVNCLTLREAQEESLARLKVWCDKAAADIDKAILAEEAS